MQSYQNADVFQLLTPGAGRKADVLPAVGNPPSEEAHSTFATFLGEPGPMPAPTIPWQMADKDQTAAGDHAFGALPMLAGKPDPRPVPAVLWQGARHGHTTEAWPDANQTLSPSQTEETATGPVVSGAFATRVGHTPIDPGDATFPAPPSQSQASVASDLRNPPAVPPRNTPKATLAQNRPAQTPGQTATDPEQITAIARDEPIALYDGENARIPGPAATTATLAPLAPALTLVSQPDIPAPSASATETTTAADTLVVDHHRDPLPERRMGQTPHRTPADRSETNVGRSVGHAKPTGGTAPADASDPLRDRPLPVTGIGRTAEISLPGADRFPVARPMSAQSAIEHTLAGQRDALAQAARGSTYGFSAWARPALTLDNPESPPAQDQAGTTEPKPEPGSPPAATPQASADPKRDLKLQVRQLTEVVPAAPPTNSAETGQTATRAPNVQDPVAHNLLGTIRPIPEPDQSLATKAAAPTDAKAILGLQTGLTAAVVAASLPTGPDAWGAITIRAVELDGSKVQIPAVVAAGPTRPESGGPQAPTAIAAWSTAVPWQRQTDPAVPKGETRAASRFSLGPAAIPSGVADANVGSVMSPVLVPMPVPVSTTIAGTNALSAIGPLLAEPGINVSDLGIGTSGPDARIELNAAPNRHPPDAHLPRHVAAQLVDVARAMPDRPVELTLNPEELGRVRMTLHATDGNMMVSLAIERPETADLMRRHIDTLAHEFRSLGYRDVAFEFTSERDRQARDHQQDPDSRTPSSAAQETAPPAQTPASPQASRSGGVDLRL